MAFFPAGLARRASPAGPARRPGGLARRASERQPGGIWWKLKVAIWEESSYYDHHTTTQKVGTYLDLFFRKKFWSPDAKSLQKLKFLVKI